MKMIQIAIGKYRTSKGGGNFTLFALGEDGVVYKSLWKHASAQHEGWLPLNGEVVPEAFRKQASLHGELILNDAPNA